MCLFCSAGFVLFCLLNCAAFVPLAVISIDSPHGAMALIHCVGAHTEMTREFTA